MVVEFIAVALVGLAAGFLVGRYTIYRDLQSKPIPDRDPVICPVCASAVTTIPDGVDHLRDTHNMPGSEAEIRAYLSEHQ